MNKLLKVALITPLYILAMEEGPSSPASNFKLAERKDLYGMQNISGDFIAAIDDKGSTNKVQLKLFSTGQELWQAPTGDPIDVKFSADGKYLGVNDWANDCSITIYEVKNNQPSNYVFPNSPYLDTFYDGDDLYATRWHDCKYDTFKLNVTNGKDEKADFQIGLPGIYFPTSRSCTSLSILQAYEIYNLNNKTTKSIYIDPNGLTSDCQYNTLASYSDAQKELLAVTYPDQKVTTVWNITPENVPVVARFVHQPNNDPRGVAFKNNGQELIVGYNNYKNNSKSVHTILHRDLLQIKLLKQFVTERKKIKEENSDKVEACGIKLFDINTQKLKEIFTLNTKEVHGIDYLWSKNNQIIIRDQNNNVFTLDPRVAVAAHSLMQKASSTLTEKPKSAENTRYTSFFNNRLMQWFFKKPTNL